MAIAIKIGSSLLKVSKSLKFLLAAGSFASYSFLFTWKFAILLMFGVGIHEMGHVYAMRRCGMKTKGFYFIPLFGGAAVSDEEFRTGKEEIYIALMGPVFGILTIALPLFIFMFTGSPFFAAAASWLAMVNLFNLFPVNPLDGGRVVKSLAFSLHSNVGYLIMLLGFFLVLALSVRFGFSLLTFIAIVGLIEVGPLAVWCLAFPTYLIAAALSRPFTKNNPPIMEAWFTWANEMITKYHEKTDSEKWDLSTLDKAKYSVWYLGMIALFITIIVLLSHIPGADISEQFLKS